MKIPRMRAKRTPVTRSWKQNNTKKCTSRFHSFLPYSNFLGEEKKDEVPFLTLEKSLLPSSGEISPFFSFPTESCQLEEEREDQRPPKGGRRLFRGACVRAGGWSQVSWAGDKEKRVGLERRRSGGAGVRWEVTPPKRRTRMSVSLFLPPHCSTSKKAFFQRLTKNFSSFSLLRLFPLSFLVPPPVSCSHTFSFLFLRPPPFSRP